MVVLITGVAGFVGSALARYVLTESPRTTVLGIDDLSSGFGANVPPEVVFLHATLGARSNQVAALFSDYKPELVFHTAAFAAEGLSPFIRCHNYQNNLLATADIVNCCITHRVRRLVFTSSMAVYGEHSAPFDERDVPRPADPYGVAKLGSELDITIAGSQHGLEWSILRLHNVYGPGQSLWQPYRNVLGIWMARALQGMPVVVYGDGSQKRAFSYIDDCVPCIVRAGVERAAAGEIINVGGTTPWRIRDVAEVLSGITGHAVLEHREARHEVHEAWCTTAKSERLLGYRERAPFSQGLRCMWSWAKREWITHPERVALARPGGVALEVERGLYSYWRPERAADAADGAVKR